MFLKLLAWNAGGVGEREREAKEQIRTQEPDIVILTELKKSSLTDITSLWPGAKFEAIPSIRKGVRFAPRAGPAMLIRDGVTHIIHFVRNEIEAETNGVLQMLTVEIQGRTRVTGAYFSPTVSGHKTEEVVKELIIDGTGQDVLVGDLNDRNYRWDSTTNSKGKALQKCTAGNRFAIKAPASHKFKPRGRAGGSTPEVMITIMRESTASIAKEGRYEGASDHTPIICTVGIQGEEGRGRTRYRRVSKMALRNPTKRKEVFRGYRRIEQGIIQKLENTTKETVQGIYKEVTEVLIEPWTTHVQPWRGGRPRYWAKNLESPRKRKGAA